MKKHAVRILRVIKELQPLERRVLAFLVDRYPNEYSLDRIAAWLDYSENTLEKNPPTRLVKLDLVTRARKADGYHYRSDLPGFVRRTFEKFRPDIDENEFRVLGAYFEEKIVEIWEKIVGRAGKNA